MKVVVGLSGGVDSAVAASLLLQQGYDVSAVFMKNWDDDDGTEYCTAQEDFLSACQVAEHLGIGLASVNFAQQYKEKVFSCFLEDMKRGLTPNPDILCNSEIKFSAFVDHALATGADKIATGHYARIEHNSSGSYSLLQCADERKDQTYFLHRLNQQQLSQSLFPLGDLIKTEVRATALAQGLPNHDRKDSTGICFIGERKFNDFIDRYLPEQPGDIVNESGECIGRHRGIHQYTIGQRKGLGIGGIHSADEQPWYVAHKDIDANRLLVVQGDHDLLYKDSFDVTQMHWIDKPLELPLECHVKIRHQQREKPCIISAREGSNNLAVRYSEQPQRAVTPGQASVFYYQGRCVGGGYIAVAD